MSKHRTRGRYASRVQRCSLALLLCLTVIAAPGIAHAAPPASAPRVERPAAPAAASLTTAYIITAASYDAWDPNAQPRPRDNAGAAFPIAARKVGMFFEYNGAATGHDTYQLSLTTSDGTQIGLGKLHTFTSASGGQALLLPVNNGYALTPGPYKAVLAIDGSPATILPWIVAGASTPAVSAGVTLGKAYLITKQSFDRWDPNAGGDPVADAARVFNAADRAVGLYFAYNGAHTGKDTFQLTFVDGTGASIGRGKIHTFTSASSSEALLVPIDDKVALAAGTYRAILLVNASPALTLPWTIAGASGARTTSPAGSVVPVIPCNAGNLEQVVACVEPSVLRVSVRLKDGEAQGTSFVIRVDAGGTYLLTNRHVVDGGSPATTKVIAADGTTTYPVTASMVNTGKPGTAGDLAVIRIAPTKLRPLAFGDSATLAAGESVASIGYGLAFDLVGPPSVTAGIVSAVNRDLNDGYGPVWIQHQSTINHGNSGGPLLDPKGNVVGVNTLSIDQKPGAGGSNEPVQGVFFAIPANSARKVAMGLVSQLQGEIGSLPRNTVPPFTPFTAAHVKLSLPNAWIINRANARQPFAASRDQLVQVLPGSIAITSMPSEAKLRNVLTYLAGPAKIKQITFAPVGVGTLHGVEAKASYVAKSYTFDAIALPDTGTRHLYILAVYIDPQATTSDLAQYHAIVQSLQPAP